MYPLILSLLPSTALLFTLLLADYTYIYLNTNAPLFQRRILSFVGTRRLVASLILFEEPLKFTMLIIIQIDVSLPRTERH
jgi:hypothetical protein